MPPRPGWQQISAFRLPPSAFRLPPSAFRLPPVTVRVLLFDTLRQSLGPEVTAEVSDDATGADLLDRLADEHPVIAAHRPTVRLAVNLRYAPLATVLRAGDEVALITPVSGG